MLGTAASLPAAEEARAATAAPAKADAQPDDKAGRSLFDGKSLEGWKVVDFAGAGDVAVEDGVLRIGMGQPMTGIAWTGGELPKSNYELTFEAQRVDGSDFFVGLTFPIQESPCTLILGGWGGGLTGFSSIDGFDASENETTSFMQVEPQRWYKVRLKVTDARAEAYVDGKRIAGFDHRGRKVGVRIEVERNRPLGFSTFQTVGGLKDIRLRELTETERAEAIAEADRIKQESE
ncbi:MAG: DUF1080 domain-containing protein [Planctomyces sp.]|nr:DUF1080 domain-containing protein [Planctomyces sp.]